MSDQRLRELEAKWRASGSLEDEAAWLQTRVQTGDLTRERLELAACLGHPAAVVAKGGRLSTSPDLDVNVVVRVEPFREWVAVVVTGRFGHGSEGNYDTVAIQAATAAALLESPPRKVVVDMAAMHYEWGNGAYAILDLDGVEVEFLLNGNCGEAWHGILNLFEPGWADGKVRFEPPLKALEAEPSFLSRLAQAFFGGAR